MRCKEDSGCAGSWLGKTEEEESGVQDAKEKYDPIHFRTTSEIPQKFVDVVEVENARK